MANNLAGARDAPAFFLSTFYPAMQLEWHASVPPQAEILQDTRNLRRDGTAFAPKQKPLRIGGLRSVRGILHDGATYLRLLVQETLWFAIRRRGLVTPPPRTSAVRSTFHAAENCRCSDRCRQIESDSVACGSDSRTNLIFRACAGNMSSKRTRLPCARCLATSD